jgi:hypothetical protein
MKAIWILLVTGCVVAIGVLGYKIATRKATYSPDSFKTKAPPRFVNDPIAELEKVDPKLIIASEAARYKTGLQELRAIAVGPEDRIYVAGDQALLILEADGQPRTRVDLGKPAYALAVEADGTVYLGMRSHVEVWDAQGARKAAWADRGPDSWITSVAVAKDQVLVGDFGLRTVARYDKSGMDLGRIIPRGADVIRDKFVIPSPYFDVGVDAQGGVWVTHTGRRTIERYQEDNTLAESWGLSGPEIEKFSGCCNPTHIALRRDGSFVTSEKGLVRIKVHGPGGELKGVVAAPKDFPSGMTGLDLAVDSKDRILVTDPGSSSIRVYILKI